MSHEFVLNAAARHDVGKGASRRLRREAGLLPGIVYGAGKEPTMITLNHNEVINAAEQESFYSSILNLKIAGAKGTEKVIIKALQRHPFKPKILHMDFFRVRADVELTKMVPLHFINEESSVGVKEGGVIARSLSDVEVSCLPKHLPEYIEVDMTQIGMDQTIHLSDLKLPEGVSLVQLAHQHDLSVISIHAPKVKASDVVADASDATGATDAAPKAE